MRKLFALTLTERDLTYREGARGIPLPIKRSSAMRLVHAALCGDGHVRGCVPPGRRPHRLRLRMGARLCPERRCVLRHRAGWGRQGAHGLATQEKTQKAEGACGGGQGETGKPSYTASSAFWWGSAWTSRHPSRACGTVGRRAWIWMTSTPPTGTGGNPHCAQGFGPDPERRKEQPQWIFGSSLSSRRPCS